MLSGPFGNQGFAVATGIETQHAKMLGEGLDLDVHICRSVPNELDSTSTGASTGPSSW